MLRRKSTEELSNLSPRNSSSSASSSLAGSSTEMLRSTSLVNLITGKEGPLEDDGTFTRLKSQKENVVLLVDNVRFLLKRKTLLNHPETMLGGMFGENMERFTKENKDGEFKIDSVSPEIFRAILGYYVSGEIKVPYDLNMYEIKEACDFFLIPFNTNTIVSENLSAFMNELSNDGSRRKFESFLHTDIVPTMAEAAMKGERECHIVCLKEDDIVDWDPEYPPAVGEDRLSVVKNNEISRFLKYIENREIAKTVLQDKGLKKIRLGIEGFPTHKDKVKVTQVKPRGGIQVTYFYVQRPFIVMSWEKEEHRSRHVDFANVSTCQSHRSVNSDETVNLPPQNLNAVDEIELVEQRDQEI